MSAGTSLEVVLWDFGGVFTPSPFDHRNDYAISLGWNAADLADEVFGYSLGDNDHPWHRLERGEISMADAMTALATLLGGKVPGFELGKFFAAMGSTLDDPGRTAMVELARDVRAAGAANVIVTNNIREFDGRWQRLIPMDIFDHVVDSSQVGFRKPNPAIFHHALGLVGARAERAVFLDDYDGNVAAAAELGIHGILVGPDPQPAISALRAVL
jgi:putative hydrolase of the HAD superfamily